AQAGEIVTFGIKPDHPATGYGYIHPGEALTVDPQVHRVERFVEKPNVERARTFIENGYLWNSGNFVFRADVMLEELKHFEPNVAAACTRAVAQAKEDRGFVVLDQAAFTEAPRISIDYAVMERTHRAAVLSADVGWSDVGQWSTVWRLSPKDADGNSLRGRAVAIDSSNVLVRSDDHLVAVIGLDNVIVVATGDAVLVADQAQSDKVKRIVVRPSGRLSLQKHYHRAEHWIVVRGAAEVTLNGTVRLVHENESIYLPIGSDHRLANPGKIDLELIEVQTGSYLGEDDIIRIDDIYNRHL